MTDYRYRYEETCDEGGVHIRLRLAVVTRKTPKGAWCRETYKSYPWPQSPDTKPEYIPFGEEFFVLDGAGKRRYHDTKERAFRSYQFRKEWHLKHLARKLRLVRIANGLVDGVTTPPEDCELSTSKPLTHLFHDLSDYEFDPLGGA